MKVRILAATIVASSLQLGCSSDVDADGVPKVDVHGTIVRQPGPQTNSWGISIPGTRMIAIGDKQMPILEFLQTYCQGKVTNETCVRATKIEAIDSIRGPRENLPAGL